MCPGGYIQSKVRSVVVRLTTERTLTCPHPCATFAHRSVTTYSPFIARLVPSLLTTPGSLFALLKKKLDTISEIMTREIVISDPIFRNNYLNSYTAFRYSTDYFMTIKIVISRKEFFSGVNFENNRPVIFVITTRNRFITTVKKTLKTKITKNFRSIYTLSLFSLLLSFIFIIIIILLFYYLRHYLIYSAPLESVVLVVSAGYIS